MKKQIRIGVFETNSSLCHALQMCTQEQFEKWKNGETWWNRWDDKFIPTDLNQFEDDEDRHDEGYITYEEFRDLEYEELFEQEYTTPNGETIVAFGYAGHD